MSLYENLCTSLYRLVSVRRLLISVLPSMCTGQQPLPLASACALCARACTNMPSSCSTHLLISLPWPVHRYWEVLFFMPVYILAHYNPIIYIYIFFQRLGSFGLTLSQWHYEWSSFWDKSLTFIPQSLPLLVWLALEQPRCSQAGIPTVDGWARLSVVNKVGQILFSRSQ